MTIYQYEGICTSTKSIPRSILHHLLPTFNFALLQAWPQLPQHQTLLFFHFSSSSSLLKQKCSAASTAPQPSERRTPEMFTRESTPGLNRTLAIYVMPGSAKLARDQRTSARCIFMRSRTISESLAHPPDSSLTHSPESGITTSMLSHLTRHPDSCLWV